MAVFDAPLRELGASVRMTNCLLNAGFGTLREAAHLSDDELLGLPNFGRSSLVEFREWLTGNPPTPLNSAYAEGNKARRRAILEQRRSGRLLREIAAEHGISSARVKSIIVQAERDEQVATRREALLARP